MSCWKFLSTPSARRATYAAIQSLQPYRISIHALREEGDISSYYDENHFISISIHALREEGDGRTGARAGGARHFYPRPPRGGRRRGHPDASGADRISIHALREEGDLEQACKGVGSLHQISIHALREEGD